MDTSLDLPDLGHYTAPVAFDQNVRDILEHARRIKEEAERGGALNVIRKFYAGSKTLEMDIDRAILTIAVEQYNSEMVAPAKIAKKLKALMHSVWT